MPIISAVFATILPARQSNVLCILQQFIAALKQEGNAMLDHVSLGVSDLALSRSFYDAVLAPLGLIRINDFEGRGSDYDIPERSLGTVFTITREEGIMPSNGLH